MTIRVESPALVEGFFYVRFWPRLCENVEMEFTVEKIQRKTGTKRTIVVRNRSEPDCVR